MKKLIKNLDNIYTVCGALIPPIAICLVVFLTIGWYNAAATTTGMLIVPTIVSSGILNLFKR